MSVELAISDAKQALNILLGIVKPLQDLESGIDAMAEDRLAEAEAKADGIIADATKRAADIDAAAEARAQAHDEKIAATLDNHATLTKAVGELTAQHADLSGKVEAKQSHLNEIEAAIAAALAPLLKG